MENYNKSENRNLGFEALIRAFEFVAGVYLASKSKNTIGEIGGSVLAVDGVINLFEIGTEYSKLQQQKNKIGNMY